MNINGNNFEMTIPSSGVNEADYILVSSNSLDEDGKGDRKRFETGLSRCKGLIVESLDHTTDNLIYTKISLPDDVKYKYFDILELRMPLKMDRPEQSCQDTNENFTSKQSQFFNRMQKLLLVDHIQNIMKWLINYYLHEDDDLNEMKQQQFFAPFKVKQKDIFDLESPYAKKKIWNILVINFILSRQRCRFNKNASETFTGIEALINRGIYTAAYPLHDGPVDDDRTTRSKLYKLWNRFYFWENLPPLDDMRDYLGNTCAVYFAWMELYTKMLFPASIFGILFVLYGLITLPLDNYSDAVCKSNITMCPVCDDNCSYYSLNETCMYAKVTHLLDNNFTIAYSTLMALWATVLAGLWRRRMKILQRKWNLIDSADEKSRPQYLVELENYQKRTGSNVKEIPYVFKLMAIIFSSYVSLFFVVLVAIANVLLIVLKPVIQYTLRSIDNDFVSSYESYISSFVSGALNLLTIEVLNSVYAKVAVYLNDREYHRTRSGYDRALIIKNVAFRFINTYTSVLYIALYKGKFLGYPGSYNKIFGHRQIECDKDNCLMELSIQLATIMGGRQLIEFLEKYVSTFHRYFLRRLFPSRRNRNNNQQQQTIQINNLQEQSQVKQNPTYQWEDDFQLMDYESEGGLSNEYLEMAIQYGFIILFTPTFPLAPLFAWVRNIFELRFDSTKILLLYRRLVPRLNPNMIIWLEIFNFLANMSVLINAFIVAFSTNVIPRLIYSWSNNGDEERFFNASFSVISTSDLNENSRPTSSLNVSACHYADYRVPYWEKNKYEPTLLSQEIWVAKLVFIILYQNIIFLLKGLILRWIPETPGQLYELQKKEHDFILSSLDDQDKEIPE